MFKRFIEKRLTAIRGWGLFNKFFPNFALLMGLTVVSYGLEMLSIAALVPFLSVFSPSAPPAGQGFIIEAIIGFLRRVEVHSLFVTTCLLLMVITLLRCCIAMWRDWYNIALIQKIRFHCKNEMFGKYMQADLKTFLHNKGGDLIYRCINLPDEVSTYFTFAPSIVIQSVNIVLLCVLLVSISLPMFLVVLGVGFCYACFIHRLSRGVFEHMGRSLRSMAIGQNVIAHEAISGIREIITYNQREHWISRFFQQGDWHYKIKMRSSFARLLPGNILEFLMVALVCVAGIYYGLRQPDDLVKALPVLTVFILSMFRMIPSFSKIGQDRIQAATSAPSVELYEQLISEKTVHYCGGQERFKGIGRDIVFKDVFFEYVPNKPVLKGLNLTIKKNQTVAIVSGSGGGKSTLIDLLLCFYPVKSGDILIDGVSLSSYDPMTWRKHIGVVSQNSFVFHASVKENIAFNGGESVDLDRVVLAAQAAGAHEFISQLKDGYDTLLGDRGYTLSGGQRQRLAIARALYHQPQIIVLDEATSALDQQTELLISDAIRLLAKEKTVIILAHRLSVIEKSDVIYVLKNGVVVEQGTHQELKKMAGEYARLYQREL